VNQNGAPRIGPAAVGVAGQPVHVFAFVDPKDFPAGLDVIIHVPGSLAPIGGFNIPPGSLIASLPPGAYAEHMLGEIRKVVASQRAAGPNANGPGIIGIR
jgi:hypothetical protein